MRNKQDGPAGRGVTHLNEFGGHPSRWRRSAKPPGQDPAAWEKKPAYLNYRRYNLPTLRQAFCGPVRPQYQSVQRSKASRHGARQVV
ncbi:hypothetical protein H206_05158 [Candidatus Electrothrix aarhusensis]|uniref:Uncharacterized protein n=1 Tax=Candidatus Electrothrix aarhusensis TaxID=1859131 RepID=A0A444J597_9BACT|nr:hypothetical protein H206_05158 [Candidatus Electrothrix aarhusensis]